MFVMQPVADRVRTISVLNLESWPDFSEGPQLEEGLGRAAGSKAAPRGRKSRSAADIQPNSPQLMRVVLLTTLLALPTAATNVVRLAHARARALTQSTTD